jgi:ribosomal protein L11 methylase PrmA
MVLARRDAASFRDPAGQVFQLGDRIFRTVSDAGAPDYEFVRDSSLLPDLIRSNRVIDMIEISPAQLGGATDKAKYLLEHPVLPFISHPYEWCFAALKSAALLQLDLLRDAMAHGVTLSDASAYNIQFRGAEPIFIDALSFRKYREGEYWLAHQQFCDQFLNPLLLSSLCGVGFNEWYRGGMSGVRSNDLNRLLSWRQKMSWRVLTHVTLPVRFQSSSRKKPGAQIDRIKSRKLPRASYLHLVGSLRNWIADLKPSGKLNSPWHDYAEDNEYDLLAREAKAAFTSRFVAAAKPKVLWDVGCNTGVYAEIALEAGARSVIGFDTDVGAVNKAFDYAQRKKLNFTPLVIDAANPSPSQGWLGLERKGLDSRTNADGLLAYACLHHLSIGQNLPLEEVVGWFIGLAPEGVIEFIEKDDPMVRVMLQLRDDIFDGYHRNAFLAAIRSCAEIIETEEIIEGRRLLVRYRR